MSVHCSFMSMNIVNSFSLPIILNFAKSHINYSRTFYLGCNLHSLVKYIAINRMGGEQCHIFLMEVQKGELQIVVTIHFLSG